jgi:hypothetical protein
VPGSAWVPMRTTRSDATLAQIMATKLKEPRSSLALLRELVDLREQVVAERAEW